jgi:uncharacterized protein YdiU (UPF0061 family)
MTEHIAKSSTETNKPLNFLFDNKFVREMPADPETDNHRRQVLEACYSFVTPRKASNPKLVAYSKEMAQTLDLSASDCESEQFTQVFVGNEVLPDMAPHA